MKKCRGIFYVTLVVVVFGGGLSGCSDEKASKDINSMKSRFEKIEDRLANLENSVKKVGLLEADFKKVQQSIEVWEHDIAARLAQISKEKAESVAKEVETPKKAKQKYYVVKRGDSLFGIARKHNMNTDQLCKLNKMTTKTVLHPGVKLLVN